MNTWGFINSFGVFQTHYATSLQSPNPPHTAPAPADISWIGSFQIFLIFFVGALTGRLTDAGYFRALLLVGTVLQVLGIFSSSFAEHSYWQLFLSQGVCMGLGNGVLFCPTIAVVSTYFSKKRALAIGMVACGSATGGLVFPSVARQMLPAVGFGWTVRTVGFLQAGTLGVCCLFLRPRVLLSSGDKGRRGGGGGGGGFGWLDLEAFKEWEYNFYLLGSFAVSVLFFPHFITFYIFLSSFLLFLSFLPFSPFFPFSFFSFLFCFPCILSLCPIPLSVPLFIPPFCSHTLSPS